ncbi:Ger(x)C family spore germination protein [Sporomusa aerivorans]|uniref:Ger(x)C family spore germination protein n=1 Tax=Sporomusa aerivorans TaxID=204936 RepID=UPI00352BB377
MGVRQVAAGLLVVLLCLVTAGCWDRRELQERGFVMAVAIDLAEDGQAGGSALESYTRREGSKPLRLSVQVLKLTPSGGGSDQPKGEGKTYVLSNTGVAFHEMVRDMLGQTSKGLYFEHIQAILISEAVLREYSLKQMIDFWRRDAEMRWRTRIFVIPGEAREVLSFQPPTGEAGGIFLAGVARLYTRNMNIASAQTDLGAISQVLDAGGDAILPRLEYKDNKVKVNGLAVFKKDRFITYWDEYTIKGIRMIRGNLKSAVITLNCPLHPGYGVTFEMFRHNTILEPHVEGDKIYFTLNTAWRGNISEVACQQYHDTLDEKFQEKAEELLAEEITHNISYSLNIAQQAGVDPMNFARYLKAYEPETWNRIKDNWEDIYPTIPLYVKARVSIQNVGEHK